MELLNIFLQLGLDGSHLRVYLANLEWGETSITNISRKAKMPRTSIYLIIKDLIKLGLITQTLKQGKTFYLPASPEYIETLLEQRQLDIQQSISELKSNMNNLKAIQNSNPKKPKVEYLEGAEGIMQAYNKSLEAKEIWIECFTQDYKDVVSEKFFDEYFEKFFGSDTKSKELLTNTPADEEYARKYARDNKLQLMVAPKQSTETDVMIYDDTVIFVSFNKEKPYALVIEDKDISNSMKDMYDLAWKQASTEDIRVKRGEKVKTEF